MKRRRPGRHTRAALGADARSVHDITAPVYFAPGEQFLAVGSSWFLPGDAADLAARVDRLARRASLDGVNA